MVRLLAAVKPEHYRFFGNAAAQYADAARAAGYEPERDLNLRVQGEDPKEQYKSVSAGLEALGMLGTACDEDDGAHVAEDLAIAEVHRPPQRRSRSATASAATWWSRCWRRTTPSCATTCRTSCASTASRARAARRTSGCSTRGASRTSSPVDGREMLPIDVLLALLDCEALRGAAIEYQIVRRPRLRALPLRVEHPRRRDERGRGGRGVDRRARAARVWRAGRRSSCWRPDALPRFAFKAARVVDEGQTTA